MKYNDIFPLGTDNNKNNVYLFAIRPDLKDSINFNGLDDLTDWEIGQINGGN